MWKGRRRKQHEQVVDYGKKGLVILMEEKSRGYIQDFKTVSNRSMMRFIFEDGSKLIGYQIEMLKNNQIPFLLRSEIIRVDQEIRISYDITSMIPLKKILERKEIGRKEFFQYLRQITGVFDQLENHLLDHGGLMLNSSMIYGSPADDRIFFTYLPLVDMEQDINESLRQFITNLIIREMKFKNEDADNYIQRLIEALKAPDFSLEKLKSWLETFSLCQNGTSDKSYSKPLSEPATPILQECVRLETTTVPAQPRKSENRNTHITTITEKKKVYPVSSWLTLGSAITAILALFAVMVMKGSFEPGNPDTLTTIIGLVLISGAVLWLICSKVFTQEKKVEKVMGKKVREPMNEVSPQVSTDIREHTTQKHMSQKVAYVNKSILMPAAEHGQHQGRHSSHSEAAIASDRTVLLARKGSTMPSIKRLDDGETVVIRQWPFRIGRMAEQVDFYIKNPAIGRIHVELTKGSDGYCITDMNTRNGTYINGVRIEPNREQPINDGDRFMLANEEFQFFE